MFAQTKMRYINNNGDAPRTRRAESESPNKVYKVKVPKKNRDTTKNSQNKLQLNTHTKERMFSPIVITITKGRLF